MFQVSFPLSDACLAGSAANISFCVQRLRGAIDARIAEEQARQKAAQEGTSRSGVARRPSARTTRQRSNSTLPTKSPDPTEFEFPLGDDDASGRSATPRQETEAPSTQESSEETGSEKQPADSADKKSTPDAEPEPKPAPTPELPADVRAKLRRLDKIDSKYHGIVHSDNLLLDHVLTLAASCRTFKGLQNSAFPSPLD